MGVPGGGGEDWHCFSASCSYLGNGLGVRGGLCLGGDTGRRAHFEIPLKDF